MKGVLMDASSLSSRLGSLLAHRGLVVAVLLSPSLALAQVPATHPPSATALGAPIHEAAIPDREGLAERAREELVYVDKAPPPPRNERPSLEPSSPREVVIPGYWDWIEGDYAWVPGIEREPPPGRFWANGYWSREEKGWRRVPGFWSDRALDKIAWRKEGPPSEHPEDRPGPAPGPDQLFIPGWYKEDGVTWQAGFWTKAQPGWVWVPARWIHQPEGWALREGFWDRPKEERGTRISVVREGESARLGDTAYLPKPLPVRAIGSDAGRSTTNVAGYLGQPNQYGVVVASPNFTRNPSSALSNYFNQTLSVLNSTPNFASYTSAGSGFAGYPYYGHGLGTSPGYYGGSDYGRGLGYYPGYYGGSGANFGQQGIQQGGLGGYPYYGHGLGYYPGYFGN
ncbi:hypothetical protein P12x_003105 [Tundrisphaera lichenicola]|uniref:hypothetical protein n=1 Tax=Tundrisphaera lichenicola TaxID=2029860 RepID=UPI003EB8AD9E